MESFKKENKARHEQGKEEEDDEEDPFLIGDNSNR